MTMAASNSPRGRRGEEGGGVGGGRRRLIDDIYEREREKNGHT